MEYLSDLRPILHSKRANMYYLEKCRILVKDGRVVYLTETKNCAARLAPAATRCTAGGAPVSPPPGRRAYCPRATLQSLARKEVG